MRIRYRSICGIVAASWVVSAHPALAQSTSEASPSANPPDSSAGDAGEIVITAQKRGENLLRVPVAVTAYTGDTLRHLGITNVQAMQAVVPALVYNNTGAYAQPYIRGVGSRLLQNGLDPSVAMYVDNRYITRQTDFTTDLADVDRVEVLKGPQGVFFGRNASAGAIRIITRDVSDRLEGYVKADAGNYGLWSGEGAVNVPLSPILGIRLSGITLHHSGYVKNLDRAGCHNIDNKNLNAIRGKVRWQPSSDFEAKLSLGYLHEADNAGMESVDLPPLQFNVGALAGITGRSPGEMATAVHGSSRKTEKAAELDLKGNVGFATLQSMTTYTDFKANIVFDADGSSARLADGNGPERSKDFSQEVQLLSKTGGRIEWILGAYYYHENTSFNQVVDIGPRIINQGLQRDIVSSIAGYGQIKWRITNRLALSGGVRYTHDDKAISLIPTNEFCSACATPGPSIPTFPSAYAAKASWSKATPSAILEYTIPNILLYTKYARGYKSGGFNYPAINAAGPAPVLYPETLDMYEVGLKGSLLDHRLRFTLSGYYYDYKDLQVTRAAAKGTGVAVSTINAADAKLYGLDADMTWQVARPFVLTAALSLEHSKYVRFQADGKQFKAVVTGTNISGMVDVPYTADGQQLLRAPNFSGFVSGTYTFNLGRGRVPLTLSYSYKGPYNFDFVLDPTTRVLHQKGYSLLNARLGYEPPNGRWSVSVWANNITKTKYFVDVVPNGNGIRGAYGNPRTFGLEGEIHF